MAETHGDALAGAEQLAGLALDLASKLERMAIDIDPDRLHLLRGEVPPHAIGAPAGSASRLAMMRLFLAEIGGMPALATFLQPAARLALLPRADIQGRLCALALACRPGVLRCCVDKGARRALQNALGSAWEPVAALGRRGGTASEAQTSRTPLHWACVGYGDWRAGLVPGEAVLHRLVGLSLPAATLEATLAECLDPAELTVPAALQQLAAEGLTWPC